MDQPTASTPIVCDLSTATDTAAERVQEYRRLFATAFTGRERTAGGVRLRFRADDGVEAWVADLAAREKACCSFFDFTVTAQGDEVCWEASVIDNDIARAVLDQFYDLPDSVAEGVEGLQRRLTDRGLRVSTNPAGTIIRVEPAAG
jgi:hypothetical protein